MARRRVEEEIESLARLRDTPLTADCLATLRKALRDRVNLVAAKAAQVAADLRLKCLLPDLLSAFDRLFQNGAESDPQCWAKNAIAKALTELEHDESPAFLRGCGYVQMEATWGGKTDTAASLRSLCNLALVQCADLTRSQKLRHLISAINDPEESVRIDALRAVEQMEGEEAVLLLRLKAAMGDARAAVVGQALESVLRLEGSRALDLARKLLEEKQPGNPRELESTPRERVQEAALALGASRLPEAFEVLKNGWTGDGDPVFLHAISALRLQAGFDFLFEIIRNGRARDGFAAIDALSLHRDSPELGALSLSTVEATGNAELRERFRAKFEASKAPAGAGAVTSDKPAEIGIPSRQTPLR